jgi:integrase
MPRRARGPRLYLDPRRQQWVIRDGPHFVRTGCAEGDIARAEGKLAEYIGKKYQPQPSAAPLIDDVLLAYAQDRVPHMRTASNVSYNIGSLQRWWSGKRVVDITAKNCRAYAATKTPAAARVDLKVLRGAVKHWHMEYGPLSTLPVIWQPPESPGRERWLTRSEAARLLWFARRTPYLTRLILIGLYTGSRPGVIKTLRWDWIDLERGVMLRKAPGQADRGNKRSPPVRLGRRILAHLRRWRRLDATDASLIVHYDGRQLDDPHRSWTRAVRAAKLSGKVTPHTLRHTRATWALQAGVSPWEVAGHLGMNAGTLIRVYGHHAPGWQENAANV